VVPEEALVLKGHQKEEFEYSKYLLLHVSAGAEDDDDPTILIPTIRYIRE